MAKFLNTRNAVAAIEGLIRSAESRLILVSPYLRLSKDFKELLTYRNSQDKTTTVIFGKQDLKPEEMKFLESLRFVILKFHEDLHAKCYMNDKKMIITSLNLYEFSMANNKEMGVLIDLEDKNDKLLFEEAYDEIQFIENTSDRFEFQFNQKVKEEPTQSSKNEVSKSAKLRDFSKSKYFTTKEFSNRTGLSSRKVNSILVKNELMYKKDDDWHSTGKGNKFGAEQKEGAYDKFIVWPEEIVDSILK